MGRKYTLAEVRAARAQQAIQGVTPDRGAAPIPSADVARALRTERMFDDSAQAIELHGENEARTRLIERAAPASMLASHAREQVTGLEPYAKGGVSDAVKAALARERARTGRDIGNPADPNRLVNRINARAASAFEYPLKLVSALLRPIDSPAPAAVKAKIEGKDALLAAVAAADPLGRYSPGGRATGRWTNTAPSWHDVAEALLERYGKEKATGVVGMSSDPSRVGAPVKEKSLLGMETAGWQGLGTAADIALSPSTYLTAGAGRGKGIQLAGRTVVPDAAVSAVARAPGSVIGPVAEAVASKLGEAGRLEAAQKVWSAGRRARKYLGPAQVLEAAPRVAAAVPVGRTTLGALAGKAFDRYHDINQISDPALRQKVLEHAQLRESATSAQAGALADQIETLLKGVPEEEQRLVRDMIENPGAFDWNVPKRDPFPLPQEAIAPAGRAAEGLGVPLGARKGQPTEKFAGSGRSTGGPGVMFGQTASPTAVPGTPDAKRYGAIPNELSGQVPTVTEAQRELAARIENVLRDVRVALTQRGLLKSGGRDNYFPRERTRESLIQQKGQEARLEKLGRGHQPRLDYRAGFQEPRKEATWINDLIARVNRQEAEAAAARGLPAPAAIPEVADSTTAINEFWRRLPQKVQEEIGWVRPEAERFIDAPRDALHRYLARATKSVNDADTIAKIGKLETEGGRVARPFVKEHSSGVVEEAYEVPVGGSYPRGPPSGPGVMVGDKTPAPPGSPQLPRGKMGQKREAVVGPERRPVAGELPGEVPPGGAEAFQGKPPFDPLTSKTTRPIPGYVYPKNAAWRQAFPDTALPRELAAWIDAFGKPYWNDTLFERLLIQPLHKVQLPWKVAATSGAGPRFALRNYMSQQVMNLQAYGPRAFSRTIQRESHILGLPDDVLSAYPHLLDRKIEVGGKVYSARELREVAKQTGLWRTMPEAEIWSAMGGPFSEVSTGTGHAKRIGGWSDPKARLSAALARVEAGAQKATRAIGPGNPFSKDFFATKGVKVGPGGARVGFHPLAEYGERQGRMAALLLELEDGKDLVRAAQDAAKAHVNYQAFSPTFEKYVTLAYPFAKFGFGITPNEVKWSLQYPGRTMFTEHLLRGGEHMVPREERERFAAEPKSQLIQEGGGRLVGLPGVEGGALKEPEEGRAKGAGRLPYVTMPPTADVFLNVLGAPARVAGARSTGKALASATIESALPAFKIPYEIATGRNVFTGEPVDLWSAQAAPRAIQALWDSGPKGRELAQGLGARVVVDENRKQKYLATPQWVNLVARYYPNIAAADLAAAFAGGKRPYDNRAAIASRLLGLTQILHDPLIPAAQEASETADLERRLRDRLRGWTSAR